MADPETPQTAATEHPTKVCIDLFSGLGGFSAAFADADEWTVYTIELVEDFDADIHADVLDLRPSNLLHLIDDAIAGAVETRQPTLFESATDDGQASLQEVDQ